MKMHFPCYQLQLENIKVFISQLIDILLESLTLVDFQKALRM